MTGRHNPAYSNLETREREIGGMCWAAIVPTTVIPGNTDGAVDQQSMHTPNYDLPFVSGVI